MRHVGILMAVVATPVMLLVLSSDPADGAIGNDDFANATVVASLPFTDTIDTTGATSESSEPFPCGSMGSTVWYAYTPTSNEVVDVHTAGSSFDTVLATYTGNGLDTILHIACSDDAYSGGTPRTWSRAVLDVTADTTYYIQVGGKFASTGNLSVTIEAVERPANDDFANATPISTTSFSEGLATSFASTEEASEPLWTCAETGHTVWYTYTPAVNEAVSVHTAGATNYTTVQAVYTGDDPVMLETIGCAIGWDHLIFAAEEGTTYRIQIGGLGEQSGWLQAQLEAVPNEPPHAEDVAILGNHGTLLTWTPIVGDTDGDTLTCRIVDPTPSDGVATVAGNCYSGTYAGNHIDFAGTDTITYEVTDGYASAVATVEVTVLGPGGTFADDDENLHEGYIEAIAFEGITKGCNPTNPERYCPDGRVTREQMASFLVRALGLPAAAIDRFDDDEGSIHEDDINALAEAGVTLGCDPNNARRFCPEAGVTREQMASFIVRGFGYSDGAGSNLFWDDDGSIHEADIDRLATAGITKGCDPVDAGRYCPTAPVLRDQMATFLGRSLGLTPVTPLPRP